MKLKLVQQLFLVVWLSFFYSSLKADCTTTTIGLCTPGTEEVIVETITEEVEQDSTGITTTTTTVQDITTTTITNQDSGDILDGSNGYVSSNKEGDMDTAWGGQGPANMPTGSNCYELGTDRCAQITGSGNSTSSMGVTGMGTTFIQTIDISDLTVTHGGRTNYTIKVDKRDPQDRIYMHVTGRYGNTSVFSGTDILSETGVTTGYQEYSGGFDFAGSLTTLVVEVGGRDINLAIGPLFDDVTINVLYNVVNTIVTQEITTVEMFVALNTDVTTEIIEVVENIMECRKYPNVVVDFNGLVSNLSVMRFYEVIDWVKENPVLDQLNWAMIDKPKHLRPNNLPEKIKKSLIPKYKDWPDIVAALERPADPDVDLQNVFDYMLKADKFYEGTKWESHLFEVFPELEEFYDPTKHRDHNEQAKIFQTWDKSVKEAEEASDTSII